MAALRLCGLGTVGCVVGGGSASCFNPLTSCPRRPAAAAGQEEGQHVQGDEAAAEAGVLRPGWSREHGEQQLMVSCRRNPHSYQAAVAKLSKAGVVGCTHCLARTYAKQNTIMLSELSDEADGHRSSGLLRVCGHPHLGVNALPLCRPPCCCLWPAASTRGSRRHATAHHTDAPCAELLLLPCALLLAAGCRP